MPNLLTTIGGENTVRAAVEAYFDAVELDSSLTAAYGNANLQILRERYADAIMTLLVTNPILVNQVACAPENRVTISPSIEPKQYDDAVSLLTQAFSQLGVKGEALGELHLRLQLLQTMVAGNQFGVQAVVVPAGRSHSARERAGRQPR
ncbi:MAG: hypothetical protein HONBIEJF_00302 [Fimbriimonadaceae bacterium]|nr:hypothetical protein [Fimbriimonadaceae bacterium]